MKTVVETVSANGRLLPPFLQLMNPDAKWARNNTFPHPDNPTTRVDLLHLGWNIILGNTDGWLNADDFLNYLAHFGRQTEHLRGKRILILDSSAKSYASQEIDRFAKEHNIAIIDLPANSTPPVDLDALFARMEQKVGLAVSLIAAEKNRLGDDEIHERVFTELFAARLGIGKDDIVGAFAQAGI